MARNSSAFCDVLKLESALVEIEFVAYLIARKINVLQSIVVDITNGYSSSIEKISKCVRIYLFGNDKVVAERYASGWSHVRE
jgi:hypothetical protein